MEVETIAELEQLLLGHLLDRVGGVPPLEARPERPSLDGLGEDDRRTTRAEVLDRRAVGRVELGVVMTTAGQVAQFVVVEVRHHLTEARIGSEEVLADVVAALHGVPLELTVDGGVHLVEEHAVFVLGEEFVPLRAPDDLDHVPARASEHGLELLDDLAVAAYWAVESLQVAVDHEHEVVEVLARGEGDRAESLGLVALTVTEERPDAAVRGVVELTVGEIAVEAGVVEGRDRTESHRDGGELPEVRHEPWMRVTREPATAATDLAAEMIEVVCREAPLKEGARVHTRGGVALKVDVVAHAVGVLAPEEVVEPDLVERGR